MADQFPQRSRRLNKQLGDTVKKFAGFPNLTSAICLLALCTGCHLSGEKPGAIQFIKPDSAFSTPEVTDPIAARAALNRQSSGFSRKSLTAQTQLSQTSNDSASKDSPTQKPDSPKIGLVSYVQDNDDATRRLDLQLPSAEPITSDEIEAEVEGEISDGELEAADSDDAPLADSEFVPQTPASGPNLNAAGIPVDAVLESTLNFYPDIQVAMEELTIANGGQIQAAGSFDTKFKIDSENTPVGFYETYRNKFAVEQPTFNGGSVFAGYRFGRGDFSTWYLERNTNAGGELSFGGNWNLLRDREIDARRVALWQSDIQRDAVEPVVHQQLLQTFRDAEIAYWNWVAAGQVYRRNLRLFQVAKNRVAGIEERIKAGDLADITRTDNDRTILSREVKLIKAQAKLDQAAIKLSLYYRDANGTPVIVTEAQLPDFDLEAYQVVSDLDGLVIEAVCCRPETKLLALDLQAIGLDLAKAQNDLLPQLNASVKFSQDIGRPTSASAAASSSTQTVFVFFDEKDEFQVDLGVNLSQSLQLRKARGKIESLSGKQRQLEIKRRFVEQKITAEVQQNYQLTMAAKEQVRAAKQNYALAQKLSAAARERIESGDADLFRNYSSRATGTGRCYRTGCFAVCFLQQPRESERICRLRAVPIVRAIFTRSLKPRPKTTC